MPNQRSAYFTFPFVTSYTECNFAKYCTQTSCTRGYTSELFVSLADRPTIEKSFSTTRTQNVKKSRNFARGIEGKKTSTEIRLRYCENWRKRKYKLWIARKSKLRASKSSCLRCELFTVPLSDFHTRCFLFP